MSIPDVTHLQFLVLTILQEKERSGRELRTELAKNGVKKTGPAFYQLMARLENDGLAEGWYDRQAIEDQAIRVRHYRITRDGQNARDGVCEFYRTTLRGTGFSPCP